MASNNLQKLWGNREVYNLVWEDYLTGEIFTTLDYANTTTTEFAAESVKAYGGHGHPARVTFENTPEGTMSIETQIHSVKFYQLLTSGVLKTSTKFVNRERVACKTAGELIISERAITESIHVYAADDDCGTEIEGTFTVTEAENAFKVAAEVFEADKTYIIYYTITIEGESIVSLNSEGASKAYKLYGTTFNKAEDGAVFAERMVLYKVQPQRNFSITNSNNGDPRSVTLTVDILQNDDGDIVDWIFMK